MSTGGADRSRTVEERRSAGRGGCSTGRHLRRPDGGRPRALSDPWGARSRHRPARPSRDDLAPNRATRRRSRSRSRAAEGSPFSRPLLAAFSAAPPLPGERRRSSLPGTRLAGRSGPGSGNPHAAETDTRNLTRTNAGAVTAGPLSAADAIDNRGTATDGAFRSNSSAWRGIKFPRQMASLAGTPLPPPAGTGSLDVSACPPVPAASAPSRRRRGAMARSGTRPWKAVSLPGRPGDARVVSQFGSSLDLHLTTAWREDMVSACPGPTLGKRRGSSGSD